jgi:pyridoxal biosynthesis lyase PdxS
MQPRDSRGRHARISDVNAMKRGVVRKLEQAIVSDARIGHDEGFQILQRPQMD